MIVDDVTLEMRELAGVLVRRGRCAETKAEIAARRLDRTEKERDDEDEAECEANLEEALTNQSKAAKVFVDKWYVNKGYAFGRAPDRRDRFHPRQRGASC